jgi:hypothetical protein
VEVLRLEPEVQAQMLALGRHGKSGQGGDAVMLVGVGDDRRVPCRGPGPPPGGDEQKATFIQEGEVSAQAAGFFLSPAICNASSG